MKYFFLILILIALGVITQIGFDKQKKSFSASAGYQPLVAQSGAFDKFNLGLKTVLADYFWLDAIQYYGGWREDHNYQKLADYLKLTTELDPKFSYPYAFSALVLPSENIQEGYTIAEKGVSENLNDWQIPYFLATSYHLYKEDKALASKYFDIAARTPGAPDNLSYVSAAYNSAPNNRSTALTIWQAIYDNSTDPEARDRAKNYIYHFELMNFYDEAAAKYQQKNGSWPQTPEDLINGGIVVSLPADPFGFIFYYLDGKVQLKSSE